ncbi:unnamed protein product [Caenorhabditis auriculariae]|uniref:Uncharacterized protein n=1 Tax=Caenorhabditis auriculariae TaxID=2777116 RepID=A0A8S1H9S1_9PELO|nr:unnamed protein product [Caenorhabditis auriculariae]
MSLPIREKRRRRVRLSNSWRILLASPNFKEKASSLRISKSLNSVGRDDPRISRGLSESDQVAPSTSGEMLEALPPGQLAQRRRKCPRR